MKGVQVRVPRYAVVVGFSGVLVALVMEMEIARHSARYGSMVTRIVIDIRMTVIAVAVRSIVVVMVVMVVVVVMLVVVMVVVVAGAVLDLGVFYCGDLVRLMGLLRGGKRVVSMDGASIERVVTLVHVCDAQQ